jgi:hypothetical protein
VNTSNGEETIYSDSYVTVTTSRVLCGGQSCEVRNITAVKMGETHPNAIPTFVAIVIGLCVLVTGLNAQIHLYFLLSQRMLLISKLNCDENDE